MKLHLKAISFILTLLALYPIGMQAKGSDKGAYIYGFATSFKDSVVYITDIQELPTARVIGKAKFLYGRDNYSYQLQTYLVEQGVKYPTCITSFSQDKKKAEKSYIKLRKRYTTEKGFTVKYVTLSEFKYQPVEIDDEAVKKQQDEEKAELAKAKEMKKKEKQEKKDAKRMGKRPPVKGQPIGNDKH